MSLPCDVSRRLATDLVGNPPRSGLIPSEDHQVGLAFVLRIESTSRSAGGLRFFRLIAGGSLEDTMTRAIGMADGTTPRSFDAGTLSGAEASDGARITDAALDGSQTRREFCVQACQAASLLMVGGFLQGCGGGSPNSPGSSAPAAPVINASVVNGAVSLTVDASSPLASAGSGALVQTATVRILVARTAQDAFTAFNATCTHEACIITGYQNQNFVCPCHGSRFATNGGVTNGPAARNLSAFATAFADPVLTISV
jgi:nitrite reductase/ring-hydroxylating ferredoxin subunit